MSSFTTQPIVVPWDFSEMSENALDEALKIADSKAQIEVVHVTPYPSAVEPSIIWGEYSEDNIRENLEKSFRKEMVDDKYLDIKFSSSFGDPGSRIVEHAEECGAGLIVISSHGRTGLPRLVMGSVAERVVRLANCPVLVLRGNV